MPDPLTPTTVLEVAVPAPLMGVFDYLYPPHQTNRLQPGIRVRVPFGRGTRVGLVMGLKATSDLPASRLRRVDAVLDGEPLLPDDLQRLLSWASAYYQHPPGEVFATAIPLGLREGRGLAEGEPAFSLTPAGRCTDDALLKRAPAQWRAFQLLFHSTDPLPASRLESLGPAWRRAIHALIARGWAAETRLAPALEPVPATADVPPELTPDQSRAVVAISRTAGFRCFLLDGVTGSGKTEVYLRCIRERLDAGQQCLVLVPEIGLTPQLLDRFRRRFPVPMAVLHSGLAEGERLRAWTAARDGTARIVIGTRSAIFTPMLQPGLIVVDEEHDASYKQQDGFRYSARDLAVWRARQLGVPLVLGSATPALESVENARSGRYERLVLAERAGTAGQPTVHLIDMRTHQPTDGLTQPLLAAIRRHLDDDGQALIFLNRRGYAPTLVCVGCGTVVGCDRCDARMVLHQQRGRVTCHHCGSDRPAPVACPQCQAELRAIGQGTERLEQALAREFPGHPLERIDRDTTRRRGEIERRLERVRSGEARLLLGTQMLTKGHDFPGVTLVGIIDVDQGLFGTDFRSAERLAQTFIQVAGRAGRADRPGEVWLQTLFPDHPLLRVLLSEGYGAFAARALEERQQAGWPPWSALALVRAEATQRAPVFAFLEEAAASARALVRDRAPAGLKVLGPAPAPMERRAGRYRGQLLLQATARRDLQRLLPEFRTALAGVPSQRRVRWSLDVDPAELF
ncbi:MAG: primosomal protein N' [Chromatiales bacterium]|nr:primosomal protein N' [Chromatiales bacterium]